MKNQEIPADRASWGATEQLQKTNLEVLRTVLDAAAKDPGNDPGRKKLGDYYAACMDEDAVERAGTAPVASLFASIAKVKDLRSAHPRPSSICTPTPSTPLWMTAPQQDFKDATEVVAIARSTRHRAFPIATTTSRPTRRWWTPSTSIASTSSACLTLGGARPKEAKTGAADVVRIETELARIEQDKVVRRDPYKVYNRVSRRELARARRPAFPGMPTSSPSGIPRGSPGDPQTIRRTTRGSITC